MSAAFGSDRTVDGGRAYTITEAEQVCGLAAHTLRWYEQVGLIHDVSRGPGGRRRYTDEHLRRLEVISTLRAAGLSVEEVKRFFSLASQGTSTGQACRQMLQVHRERLQAEAEGREKALRRIERRLDSSTDGATKLATDVLERDVAGSQKVLAVRRPRSTSGTDEKSAPMRLLHVHFN